MSDSHEHTTDDALQAHEHEHHGGNAKYLAVFGALVVLTLLSFILGNSSLKDTAPHVAWAGMMAVSCAKALLVMLFFMHLLWEANWKYVLTIPASLMSLFLVLMLVPDVGMRTHHYNLRRWIHASEPATVTHGEAESDEGADPAHPADEKAHTDH